MRFSRHSCGAGARSHSHRSRFWLNHVCARVCFGWFDSIMSYVWFYICSICPRNGNECRRNF